MKKQVLIVGYGRMGQFHHKTLTELGDVDVKIYDPYLSSYSDTRVLSLDDYDVICIATPVQKLGLVVRDLVHKQATLLIEKPFAKTFDEGMDLAGLLHLRDHPTYVGYSERFNPVVIEFKNVLRSGQLGTVYNTSAFRISPNRGERSDLYLELMSHDIDLVNHLFSEVPTDIVWSSGDKKHPSYLETTVNFSSILSTFVASWHPGTYGRQFLVFGEKGWAELDFFNKTLSLQGKQIQVKDKLTPLQFEWLGLLGYSSQAKNTLADYWSALTVLSLHDRIAK